MSESIYQTPNSSQASYNSIERPRVSKRFIHVDWYYARVDLHA
ncbi:hypothetical protein [Motilimonas cestriensis]|nr:hypothetical protein [Motilimonas cestriensis]